MRKMMMWMALFSVTVMLTACGTKAPGTEMSETQTTEEAQQGTETAQGDVMMDDLAALLGMEDSETAALFGGGEENWSEDKKFYIGRIFDISLDGDNAKVFTTCSDEKIVESVSIWMTDGETPVTEADVERWVSYIRNWAGSEAEYDDTSSEGGSKIWKWKLDGMFATLYQNGDIISVSLNPAVGELK